MRGRLSREWKSKRTASERSWVVLSFSKRFPQSFRNPSTRSSPASASSLAFRTAWMLQLAMLTLASTSLSFEVVDDEDLSRQRVARPVPEAEVPCAEDGVNALAKNSRLLAPDHLSRFDGTKGRSEALMRNHLSHFLSLSTQRFLK